MGESKIPDRGYFVGIISLVAAIFIPVLQANGVDLNWQASLVCYVVLTLITVWSLLRYAIPHFRGWKRISIAAALIVLMGSIGLYATKKEYSREHPISSVSTDRSATGSKGSTGSTASTGTTGQSGATTPPPPPLTHSQDKMTWDYDSHRPDVYFLALCKCGGMTTISAFQAVGDNATDNPIHITKMYLRSDINNAMLPVLISVANYSGGIPGGSESVEPQNTSGVPAHAHFRVSSANISTLYPGQPVQVPVEIFLKDFIAFTFVVDYDGGHYERHFSADEVKKQVAQFEVKVINESTRGVIPRVTKKPDSSPQVIVNGNQTTNGAGSPIINGSDNTTSTKPQ